MVERVTKMVSSLFFSLPCVCLVYMPADRPAMGALTLGWDQARTHLKTWAYEKLVNAVIAYNEFLSLVDQLTVDKNMGPWVCQIESATAKIQASQG